MKKILFLFIAILISITVDAQKWYVATTGNDASGNGTALRPWKTVKHAADTITTANGFTTDTIFVAAGVYDESTNQIVKSLGITLMGVMNATDTTHIISSYTNASSLQAFIQCASTAGTTTNDNSSICYLKITGNSLTASRAIYIGYRNNIKIHHCTIEDFLRSGIYVYVSSTYTTLYATGIEIHDNIINNCADQTSNPNGCIILSGADGVLTYNNTSDMTERATGENGHTVNIGRCKNHKTYNNTFTRNDHEVTAGGSFKWNFFWEEWNYRGNGEFYNNTLYGLALMSLGGADNQVVAGCSYGYKVYENQWLNAANGNRTDNGVAHGNYCLNIEGQGHQAVEVYKNYIQRFACGIEISTPSSNGTEYWSEYWKMDDIDIHHNIIENTGYADHAYSYGILWLNETNTAPYYATFTNILIANNVITGDNGGTYPCYNGISFNPNGTITGLKIQNNIITDCANRGIYIGYRTGEPFTINNGEITYNLNNGNGTDAIYVHPSITLNNVDHTTGNITDAPLFVGTGTPPLNYKLQETSPARDAGTSVGLTSDYGGYSVPIGSAPDIGAWEYGADVTPPNWTPQGIGWDRMYQKLNFRDSINFTRGFMIAGVPISASGSGLEILGGLTASVDDLNNTSGSTGNLQGQINAIKASTVDDSKADTSLSNLSSVAINTHLLPATSGSANLGSALLPFGSVYANGTVSLPSTTSIGSVSSTEIGYVNNVTSAIQTQFNATKTRIDSIVTVLADTANIETLLQIDFDTDTVASLSDVRSLAGSGVVGVTLNSGTLTLTGSDATADDITFYTNGDGQYDLPAGGGNLTIMSQVQGWINDSLDILRTADSDTIPLFVFGLGSGHSSDTAIFNNGRLAGAFYNSGSDTLYVTELRGVLVEGTGTETIAVQVSWDVNMKDATPTNLNTAALAVTSMTSGTVDATFDNNGIPPGMWVWCSLSGASANNKPTMLTLTMTGYRRNRSY